MTKIEIGILDRMQELEFTLSIIAQYSKDPWARDTAFNALGWVPPKPQEDQAELPI